MERKRETDRVSGFYSPSKADISSSRTPLPLLVHRQGRHTFLFFFYFPSSILSVIYTGGFVLIPSTGMNIYDGREEGESDTFKESFLLRIYSCTDRGRWYILRHRENLYTRVEEELFTHIIFPPLNTFSPNYFFLVGNSVRRGI